MPAPPRPSLLRDHYQLAYVTTDIERAMAMFRRQFGIPAFLIREAVTIDIVTPAGAGPMTVSVATAWIGDTMYELIEPLAGQVGLFRDALPETGFGIAFHHCAFEFPGDRTAWLTFRRDMARTRAVALEAPLDCPYQFLYTDERPLLGHYHEYNWFGENDAARQAAPRY